jgi:Bacterial toxin 44
VYAGDNSISRLDTLGLATLLVTMPNGSSYQPWTNVKNSAQARSFGWPVGFPVPIAVPEGINPQNMVDDANLFNFYSTWSNPANDYKRQNAKYDAYGNFEYGASGRAAGFTCEFLQYVADHKHKNNVNNPINTRDIQSGWNAINSGGKLSVAPGDFPTAEDMMRASLRF